MKVRVKSKDKDYSMPWKSVTAMFFIACGCGCFILSCIAGMLVMNQRKN